MIEMLKDSLLFLSPILLVSLYMTALVIDIIFSLNRRIASGRNLNQIQDMVYKGQLQYAGEAVRSLSQKKLLKGALRIFQKNSPPDREDYLFDMALKEIEVINRKVSILPSLANIATLLGLLGTVSGMITVFYQMKISGSSDPYILAGGISQALITTAAGLIIAVPAYLFHLGLRNRLHLLEEQLEQSIDCIMMLYREKLEDARKKVRVEES